jgi:hypothetical protein
MASKKMLQGEEECKKQNKQGRRETRKNVVLSTTLFARNGVKTFSMFSF